MYLKKSFTLATVFFLGLHFSLLAEVVMQTPFTDNMVLQRNMKVPVWGTAAAEEAVTVSFNGLSSTAQGGSFIYNPAGSSLVYSPPEDYNGKDTLIYYVSDSAAVVSGYFTIQDTIIFTIHALNDKPILFW